MLANINLLPEKKQKNYASLLVIGVSAILLAGALAFLFNRIDADQAFLIQQVKKH
ncbi:hypothetical protein [Metabacillus sp. RGM 3146]|uniref:hypothetical protein n=1 Tax=Metabacillus sp. RGM 3146 TaxID=3401092 RepID=UPI003B9C02B8